MTSKRFMVAVEQWPMMVARLLIAVAGSDGESTLSSDLAHARQLATLLGEGSEVIAELSRTLLEKPPAGESTVPHVQVDLAEWSAMRARLLVVVVEQVGSVVDASAVLGLPVRWIRCEVWKAKRHR